MSRSSGPSPTSDKPVGTQHRGSIGRWVVIAVVGAVAGMWLLGFFLYATHEHDFFEGQVADRAAPICARAAERMEQDPPLPDEPTPEDRAREVEELTVIYADALEELRRLKQPGRDEAYDKWLSAWQQFVDLGPRFADALRTGDPEIYEPVGNEGDDPARVMNSIARDNGMDTCVF